MASKYVYFLISRNRERVVSGKGQVWARMELQVLTAGPKIRRGVRVIQVGLM